MNSNVCDRIYTKKARKVKEKRVAVSVMMACDFKKLSDPPYKPYLAPKGFFLFLTLKKDLRGKHTLRMNYHCKLLLINIRKSIANILPYK